MYETKTQANVHAEMLTHVDDSVDKRQGSVAFDLTAPNSFMLEALYVELDAVLSLGFADTSAGYWLERRTKELGVPRKAATKSVGSVTLSHTGIITVPAGERLVANTVAGLIYFVTMEDAALNNNSVTVSAEAEVGGAAGNVATGAITAFAAGSNFSSVVTVFNAENFFGGTDIESDEALLERYKLKVGRPATSGNANQYEQWALEVAGIRKARVYPVWNGGGTVKVVIVDSNGRAPSTDKVTEVAAYIESLRPVGALVTVEPAIENSMDISATITLDTSVTPEEVAASYATDLSLLFAERAFKTTSVKYAELAALLLDQPGVTDYSNFTVEGGTENITLAENELAVVGTVTFNVA